MSASTIILIFRSLWPFIKEVILRDKGLREFLMSNLAATVLAGCLMVVFMTSYYLSLVASDAIGLAEELREKNRFLQEQIDNRVCLPEVIEPTTPRTPADRPPLPPPRPAIKLYTEERLKSHT